MTVAVRPRTPTGDFHDVPVDDLFFSTTDAKGVIDEANEVFTRNSRFARDELLGTAHNVIRHPDMPGAVFHVMWAMLEAGQPVCAYVKNLAADGSTYRAFATVVPIGNRYLSVRSRPCNDDARELVESLYADVRAAENAARADGMSAHDAAAFGAERLATALAANGFPSYADFQLELVPAEVVAREAVCPPIPDLPDSPEPVRAMLVGVGRARALLGSFADDLERSIEQVDRLGRDVRRVRNTVGAVVAALADAQAAAERTPVGPDLVVLLPSLTDRLQAVQGRTVVADEAGLALVRTRRRLRLSGAIARLHAEAIGRYVVAVAQGGEDPRVSERALSSLTDAAMGILDADLAADHAATDAYADQVEALARAAEGAGEVADAWCQLASANAGSGPGGLREAVREVRVALDGTTDQLARVRSGMAVLGSTAVLDRDRLAETLTDITGRAGDV